MKTHVDGDATVKDKLFIKAVGFSRHPDADVGVTLIQAGDGITIRVNDGVGWGAITLTSNQTGQLTAWLATLEMSRDNENAR